MDEFFETQMILASDKADKTDSAEAEQSVKMSLGQTPTIDANIHDPKSLRDAGYPLSNPTVEPNRYTKPGARIFAGRDAYDGRPIIRPTIIPKGNLQTSTFISRMDSVYSILSSADNAFVVETGISKAFEHMIKYTNSLSDMDPILAGEEANRVKWATSDRLESIGFDHVYNSERTTEGIDDKGLDGLQMMMSAQIMRGVTDFTSVTSAIGDTGANAEQLEETWNKAVDAYHRASKEVIQGLPTDEASALQDPRYLSAAGILSDAIGDKEFGPAKNMDEQTLYGRGMFLVDMVKGNPLFLAAAVYQAKKDPIVADALNFLLDADEGMNTTWADFGRGVLGAALDPLSYVGIGLAGQAMKGAARTGAARLALKQAGLVGIEGAVFGSTYTGLMDYGFQNIDILSDRQEEFSISRSATMIGFGAGAGFIFGSALSGLTTGASKLLNKWVQRNNNMKGLNPLPGETSGTLDYTDIPLSAAEEFKDAPIPDNVIPEEYFKWRREVAEEIKAEMDLHPFEGMDDLLPGDPGYVNSAVDELINSEINEHASKTIIHMIHDTNSFKGISPKQIYDDILSAMNTITDNFHNPPDVYSLDNQAWLVAHKSFRDNESKFITIIKENRGLKVIEGKNEILTKPTGKLTIVLAKDEFKDL